MILAGDRLTSQEHARDLHRIHGNPTICLTLEH
jgi:hypothetical protein